MRTNLLMWMSAAFMGICGLVFTFMPQETLVYWQIEPLRLLVLILQLTGGLYFGFALLNWMGRDSLMGGIFGRAVAIGNFAHFLIGALALLKAAVAGWGGTSIIAGSVIYSVFAVWFGLVLFTHPSPPKPS
ncbi:MAG TPA: hypothetical protein VM009_03695 [Terriglobales bacterium]|nr:hypothetical protein [Terriglobales bacterium]